MTARRRTGCTGRRGARCSNCRGSPIATGNGGCGGGGARAACLLPLPVAADLPTLDGLMVRAAQAGVMAFAPNLLRYCCARRATVRARRTVGKPAALFAAHRARQGTGGDIFAELALPLIDLAMWVVSGEVERVQVMAERLFAAESVPDGADTALMLLRFASGLTATLEVACSLPETAPQADELLVEYLGLDAVLRATPTDLAVTVTGGGVRSRRFPASGGGGGRRSVCCGDPCRAGRTAIAGGRPLVTRGAGKGATRRRYRGNGARRWRGPPVAIHGQIHAYGKWEEHDDAPSR